MKTASFYEGPWYMFSNFSAFSVRWRGHTWPTAEHAYQAAKFTDGGIAALVRKAPSAHDAKKIAQAHAESVRPDWEIVRVAIMEEIVRAKVDQHPYVAKKLIQSDDLEIIEDSPTDGFWGRGPDYKGLNMLGKIYMKIRAEQQDAFIQDVLGHA
jgi:ribA/ribD-fused uncharacterized protein